jgi:hypothetical protein
MPQMSMPSENGMLKRHYLFGGIPAIHPVNRHCASVFLCVLPVHIHAVPADGTTAVLQ